MVIPIFEIFPNLCIILHKTGRSRKHYLLAYFEVKIIIYSRTIDFL
jgi:hypothetical protein